MTKTGNQAQKTIIQAFYNNTTTEQQAKAQQQAINNSTTAEQQATIKRIFEALKSF